VAGRPRSDRSGTRPNGRHLLRSPKLAAELVHEAGIRQDDHVVEIGAGTGRLTRALADRGARVTAIEIDPDDARRLRATFTGDGLVEVVEADALVAKLPSTPFRVFGNLPFSIATPILRRLLDEPRSPLEAADVLIQFESARKRAQVWPSTAVSIRWLPWWELTLARRIPRFAFEPVPSVAAGLLAVRRRPGPLLDERDRAAFAAIVGRAFRHGALPVRRSLRAGLPPMSWKRLARERGLPIDAAAGDLNVFDWVAVYRIAVTAR
jgi:23S rRNA (adenine-N6)-dimethyltransferase